jgi:hypothetical protein
MLLASIALVAQTACTNSSTILPAEALLQDGERVCRNLASPQPSQRSGVPRLRLLVTLDPRSATRTLSMNDVARQVQQIWSAYADVVFADDNETAGGAAYDDRLRLLILERRRSEKAIDAGALGWIDFVSPSHPVDTINVSLAVATSLLGEGRLAGVPIVSLPPSLGLRYLARILAAGIAHEIGHYLLRSSVHTTSGLMRERLPFFKIVNGAPDELRLLPGQVEILERRLSAKLFAEIGNKSGEALP